MPVRVWGHRGRTRTREAGNGSCRSGARGCCRAAERWHEQAEAQIGLGGRPDLFEKLSLLLPCDGALQLWGELGAGRSLG